MKEELKCPICNEPTNVYMGHARKDRLCKKHGKMANAGEIIQCATCGKWNEKDVICECKKDKEEAKNDNELTCIICGAPSNNKHFCLSCWKKYHEKSIDIRITNCNATQILDEYGNKKIKCSDGVWVRSRAESMISDWFFMKKIRVVYEPDFFYKENDETKVLHPDFFLPDHNVYIEYCELTNKPYLRKKEYTEKIYKENNKNVIIMNDTDIENRDKFFFEKLNIN